jgi:hypothetical protein
VFLATEKPWDVYFGAYKNATGSRRPQFLGFDDWAWSIFKGGVLEGRTDELDLAIEAVLTDPRGNTFSSQIQRCALIDPFCLLVVFLFALHREVMSIGR